MKRRPFYPLFESRAKAKVLYANAEFYLHALGVKREGERDRRKKRTVRKGKGVEGVMERGVGGGEEVEGVGMEEGEGGMVRGVGGEEAE